MDYKTLEQEVAQRKDNLTKPSWRGDLTKMGLKLIQWGDLNYIQSEVINKPNVK